MSEIGKMEFCTTDTRKFEVISRRSRERRGGARLTDRLLEKAPVANQRNDDLECARI